LERANDGSPEFRLAQSLAATRARLGNEMLWFREHLEPLDIGSTKECSWVKWAELPTNDVAWRDGDLTDALNATLARRLVRVNQSGAHGWPDWSPRSASLDDITAFIERRTNDALLADLIWGLSLVDWTHIPDGGNSSTEDEAIPSSFYALLRLCFRRANKGEEQEAIPLVPSILHRAIAGDGTAASEIAARRLRASGHAPLVRTLPVSGAITRRTAAAMLFPIAPRDFRLLEYMTLKQHNHKSA
jgi:CRISPR-associated protein Csx17